MHGESCRLNPRPESRCRAKGTSSGDTEASTPCLGNRGQMTARVIGTYSPKGPFPLETTRVPITTPVLLLLCRWTLS